MSHVAGSSVDDIPVPDVSHLTTEDDEAMDNVFSEKQMRLLTEPLYASWKTPNGRPFFLAANVAVFAMAVDDPLVPDVFLSMDTAPRRPFAEKLGRSYFIWEHGKPPDVVIEIVSNREGGELTRKLRGYERMRVAHYVVFDPFRCLTDVPITRFRLDADTLVEADGPLRIDGLGLGLEVWRGSFEEQESEWLRWCDLEGTPVPTGAERADHERERADHERERADMLAEKLKALGVDPDDLSRR